MINLKITRKDLNAARLDADLRAALGDACLGISAARDVVIVHLRDDATPRQQSDAAALVAAHDPAALTPAQQENRDRAALPFYTLSRAELLALAETMDAPTFRREMVRAFAFLRDALRRGQIGG